VPRDSSLRRFWFPIPGHLGIGVTAASRAEAEVLASKAAAELQWSFIAASVVEDIDVRDLDQGHVVPNMAPPDWRGVWFPRLSV
jgi:hypothetical protein